MACRSRALILASVVCMAASPVWAVNGEPNDRLLVRRTETAVEVEGAVPNEAARRTLTEAAARAVPELPVTTILTENSAVPIKLVDAAIHAFDLLPLFAEGEIVLSANKAVVSGSTFHQRALTELEAALPRGWPDGYEIETGTISAAPAGDDPGAAACESAIAALIDGRPIEFEAGRADLRADSRHLLDEIAYAAERCPTALVAVSGHTDSDGASESNYALSLERAQTVIDLLVSDGLPADRFTPLGYGESRPLASNATLEGKARNRRIEFSLRD
jgi:OmpA-OmpF porin, OOP family